MQLSFEITFNGGEQIEVTNSPLDLVKAERWTGTPLTEGNPSLETLYYLAYSAARSAGKAGSDFDAWLGDVESIEFGDAEEADPKAPQK